MKTITKAGKTFEVNRLGRAQLRELRKRGLDLVQKAFRMGSKEGTVEVPITGEELENLLDVSFPGREADLDAIGVGAQIELVSLVISETFAQAEELKN
jgi:hypothetical protein